MKLVIALILSGSMLVSLQAAEEVPSEIKVLQDQRAQNMNEVNQVYRQGLERLKAKYAKAGDLNSTRVIADALKELGDELQHGSVPKWNWSTGGSLIFWPNHAATHTRWKNPGRWWIEGGLFRFESDSGETFKVSYNFEAGAVESLRDGKKTTLILKE